MLNYDFKITRLCRIETKNHRNENAATRIRKTSQCSELERIEVFITI